MGNKRSSIGLWAFIWGGHSEASVPHEKAVETVAGMGFDGVEVAAYDPYFSHNSSRNRRALRKLYDDNGLDRSGLTAPFPSAVTTDSVEYLDAVKANLDICVDVVIPTLRVDTGASPDLNYETPEFENAFSAAAANWHAAAEECASAGVSMVWEFDPGFLFNKPSEILSMVEKVDHPNFSLLFDSCHAYMCCVEASRQAGAKEILPGGVNEFATMCKGKIGHVHLVDSDGTLQDGETSTHVPLGAGRLDFDIVIPALNEAGCNDDWWVIDLSFWPKALEVAAENKKYLDRLIDKYGR
jgi:sugar phosphate isomerase/epimerase